MKSDVADGLFFFAVYPIIQVHNQLIGGPLGSNITLDCMVEASPKPINYWARESGIYQSEIIFNVSRFSPSWSMQNIQQERRRSLNSAVTSICVVANDQVI